MSSENSLNETKELQGIFAQLVKNGIFPESGLSVDHKKIDQQFVQNTLEQLGKYNLNPDGHTLYICDTGIGHGVLIAAVLSRMGVRPEFVIDQGNTDPAHLLRYQRSLEEYRMQNTEEDSTNPETVSKDEIIVLDGHSTVYKDKFDKIKPSLPSGAQLKLKGISRVVLIAEANFQGELQTNNDYYFGKQLPLIDYLNGIDDSIDVYAIGVDPR
jgi:hypothetical protein